MHTSRLLVAFLAFLVFAPPASAATFVVPPDEWMIDDASAIITGTVTHAYPRFTARGQIETVFVVAVDEVLKGKLTTQQVEVVEWGGRIGDKWMAVAGGPRYQIGKRYLIFLNENRAGQWTTQDLTLGRFEFSHSNAGDLLVRDASQISGWDIHRNPAVETERISQSFLSFVRGKVNGLKVQADYFADHVVRAAPARGRLASQAIVPNFAAYDFADASTVGVQSWTSDSGSDVNFSISATPASGTGSSRTQVDVGDSEERIIEEDPNGDISGAFSGSGVVATAFYGGSGDNVFEGQSYVTLSGSDIVTQNGVKASNLSQSTLRTVMAHEVGHTLGFRHSDQDADGAACTAPLPCSTSAVMNSFVSPTDGSLQGWDVDAVQATYGAGGTASDYTTTFCSGPGCHTRRGDTNVAFRLAELEEVCVPPSISVQPANKTITPPETSTSLSVTPGGSSPFTYQWFVGNSGDTSTPFGTNSSSINVAPVATTNYWVRITGQCAPTVDSNTATVTLAPCVPPQISSHTTLREITAGMSIQLIVNATGTALHYQWFIGPLGNTSQPTGADNKNLTVSPTETTSYWVRVTGACEPEATSGAIVVTVEPCPEIVVQTPTTTPSGNNVILSVEASSSAAGPLSYAWFRGSTPGVGGTLVGSAKSVTVLATSDVRTYWVRVTNSCNNSVASELVAVASCSLPGIATQPLDQSIVTSASATLSLVLSGNGSGITVTWYRGTAPDKTNQIGTGTSVNVGPLTVTTSYWAAVRNNCGEVSTRTAIITVQVPVCTAPAVTTSPVSQQVRVNSPVSLSVAATGTAVLQYQWYEGLKGDTVKPLTGATLSTFVSDKLLSPTSFWARVTNGCGTANSEAALVTVTNKRRRAAVH